MAIISNRGDYAVRAMIELAKHQGGDPITIPEIARRQHLPSRFLEAILRVLKSADLIESVRGKNGGYILKRPARSITVLDIVQNFVELEVIEPVKRRAARTRKIVKKSNAANDYSAAERVYGEALNGLVAPFRAATLEQLATEEQLLEHGYINDYSI